MSQVLLLADIHFHEDDFQTSLTRLESYLDLPGHDICFICGDIFDKATIGGQKLSSDQMIAELNRVLGSASLPIVIIAGNHDHRGSRLNALNMVSAPNVTKVYEPTTWELADFNAHLFPWVSMVDDHHALATSLSPAENQNPSYLFGHMSVHGASMGIRPVDPRSYFAFAVEEFDHLNLKAAYLGHLHKIQSVGNFHYIGSMTQRSFGEEGYRYGVWSLDTKTGITTHISIPSPTHHTVSNASLVLDDGNHYRVDGDKSYSRPEIRRKTRKSRFAETLEQWLEVNDPDDCRHHPLFSQAIVDLSSEQTPNTKGPKMVESVLLHDTKAGTHEVKFSSGLNIIVGRNGSGKTSIVESIYACLYGKFVRRGNVKNFFNSKLSQLGLKIINNDDQSTKILIEPSKRWIDGKPYQLVNEFLEVTVDRFGTPEHFQHLSLSDQSGRYSMVKMGDTERLMVFREFFGFSDFTEANERYRASLQNYRAALNDRKKLTEKIASLESMRVSVDLDLYERASAEVQAMKDELAKDEPPARVKALNAAYRRHGVLLGEADAATIAEIKKLRIERARIKADQERYGCIGCKDNPILSCSFLANYQAPHILDDYDEMIKALEQYLEPWKRKELPRELLLEQNIIKADEEEWIWGAMDSCENRKIAERDLSEKTHILSQIKNGIEMQAKLEAEIVVNTQALEAYQDEDYIIEGIKTLEFLVHMTSKKGISTFMLQESVDHINSLISELEQDSSLEFGLHLQLTAKGMEIMCANGKEVEMLSDGQQNLAQLLLRLALLSYSAETAGSHKLLILDEPTTGVDQHNTEVVGRLLRSMNDRGVFEQIIVVTHCQALADKGDVLIEIC